MAVGGFVIRGDLTDNVSYFLRLYSSLDLKSARFVLEDIMYSS